MTNDLDTAIKRLEDALELIRRGDVDSWYDAYLVASQKTRESGSEDWAAIRALVVVATHGEPNELSYLDEELKALIKRAGDEA